MAEPTFLISANVFSKLRCRQARHHKFSPKRLIQKKYFKNPLPEDPTEASAELARLGEEAKVYAGGTELILLLRLGLVHSAHLVDVKKIPALGELAWDGKTMHIGAAATHPR